MGDEKFEQVYVKMNFFKFLSSNFEMVILKISQLLFNGTMTHSMSNELEVAKLRVGCKVEVWQQ